MGKEVGDLSKPRCGPIEVGIVLASLHLGPVRSWLSYQRLLSWVLLSGCEGSRCYLINAVYLPRG